MKITELQPHQFILPKTQHEARVLLALVKSSGIYTILRINGQSVDITQLNLLGLTEREKIAKNHFDSRQMYNISITEKRNESKVKFYDKIIDIKHFSVFDLDSTDKRNLEKPIEILSLSDIEYNEEKLRKWGIYPEVTFPSTEESLAKLANTLVEIKEVLKKENSTPQKPTGNLPTNISKNPFYEIFHKSGNNFIIWCKRELMQIDFSITSDGPDYSPFPYFTTNKFPFEEVETTAREYYQNL